jgi:hypothetical protein
MKRTLKRESKVLEIVEGEAFGGCWMRPCRKPSLARRRQASGAGQCGLAAREKPFHVESLWRAAGRGNSGRSDTLICALMALA